jgi:hypothetical protein
MYSPTSSAASESSRSTSPDTGATTPCSVLGGSSILSLPSIYVYFVGTSFTASNLEETFKKHASDNRMGVIIDQNSVDRDNQSFSCKGEWMPLSLSHGNGGSTFNYFISTTVNLEDHVLPVGFIYRITCLLPPDPCLFYSLRPQPSYTRILHEQVKKLSSLYVVFGPYFQSP